MTGLLITSALPDSLSLSFCLHPSLQRARAFVGPDTVDQVSAAVFALEQAWVGPVVANTAIAANVRRIQLLERVMQPAAARNWRFQQLRYGMPSPPARPQKAKAAIGDSHSRDRVE
jgi:hypothetical protein